MFEFQKLCNEVENLNPAERAALIGEKSLKVIKGLRELDIEGLDPVLTLASFVVGSAVSDGVISEKGYLFIYPSLEKAFGGECNLAEIKQNFKVSKNVQKAIEELTRELIGILAEADELLANDIIMLCLLVTSVDGKVTLKEKRYVKQLCKS